MLFGPLLSEPGPFVHVFFKYFHWQLLFSERGQLCLAVRVQASRLPAWPEEPGPAGQGCRGAQLRPWRLRGVLAAAAQQQHTAAVPAQLVEGWNNAGERKSVLNYCQS